MGRACVGWVEKYFKDCVRSPREEASFALGMASLLLWGVAEIPQIITNFQTKSGHGVSLGLLFTWVVGDIFNLVGCLLEPATLPTQFYTALLYTTITVLLVLQTLYYDYILSWWKCRSFKINPDPKVEEGDNPTVKHRPTGGPTTPILLPLTNATTLGRDVYCYTSARSLANSGTPTLGCYLGGAAGARSDPAGRGAALLDASSGEDEESPRQHHRRSMGGATSRSVGYGTFITISASLPFQTRALMWGHLIMQSSGNSVQETGTESNPYGLWLGWIMATIYMGGRLPQIFLNIKRGSVEGLNPLMFMLALLANATYVGSILVRSMEWKRMKGNAPWLLDAVVCVLLDLFILLQFAYYKFVHRRRTGSRIDLGDYEEIKKPST
uniref:Protein RTC2 n=1 Tax=Anthurium amnicola TaxID=1678845 RepID=A0A1D1YUT7_9ARAE